MGEGWSVQFFQEFCCKGRKRNWVIAGGGRGEETCVFFLRQEKGRVFICCWGNSVEEEQLPWSPILERGRGWNPILTSRLGQGRAGQGSSPQ